MKAALIEIMGDFGPGGGGEGVIASLPALSCLTHVADNTSKPGISGTPVSSSACGDRQAFTPYALNTEKRKICNLNFTVFLSSVHLFMYTFLTTFYF